ncbi:hypothetical protein [Pseudodesulfovibrio aespoeensis]|nr:hypothetical protein [Pseudodesulfovibrio aespoeensis]MCG2733777.1 hypothetical protein [Pseudodesulfovibrio aespoeensis]
MAAQDGAIDVREAVPDADLLDRFAAPPDRVAWWRARLGRVLAGFEGTRI